MLSLVIVFSVLAALLNASSAVIQRYEAGQAEAHELFRSDFMKTLTKNPKWIAGFGLQILAFLCQAAALRKGSLLVVEPILTIDLIFMMLILYFNKHVPVGKQEWLGIGMISAGLSGMLLSASPKVGSRPYTLPRLTLAVAVIALAIAIGIYVVRRTKLSSYRAAIAGMAAGFSFALVAVFTKIVTGELGHGFAHLLTSWPVWALFGAGIVSIIMMQNTYGAGPVAVSQPAMEIVEPLISVVLGIYLFGDSINLNITNLTLAAIAALVAGSGITILSRSKKLQSVEI